jgi:hypothetical protein
LVLCAIISDALFYALRAILREAIFVMGRLDTKGVGLWHWGGAGELARQRPTPVPQTHSSLRSGSLYMTIFLFLL